MPVHQHTKWDGCESISQEKGKGQKGCHSQRYVVFGLKAVDNDTDNRGQKTKYHIHQRCDNQEKGVFLFALFHSLCLFGDGDFGTTRETSCLETVAFGIFIYEELHGNNALYGEKELVLFVNIDGQDVVIVLA